MPAPEQASNERNRVLTTLPGETSHPVTIACESVTHRPIGTGMPVSDPVPFEPVGAAELVDGIAPGAREAQAETPNGQTRAGAEQGLRKPRPLRS
jgi:hypothetical protein